MALKRASADDKQQSALQALQRGDLQGARAQFVEPRIAYQKKGDAHGEAQCWHRLGAVSLRADDLEEATFCFGTARDICEENRDGRGFANALHQLGNILIQRQQYEQARAHSRSALSVQHEIGDRAGVARSLYQIACTFMEENNIVEAVTGYRHAIKVMKSVEDLAGVAMSLYHLSLLAQRASHAEAAYRLMLASAGLQQHIGDPNVSSTFEDAQVLARNAGLDPAGVSEALNAALREFISDDGEGMIAAAFPEATG